MVPDMKESGNMEDHKVLEYLFTPEERCMKAIGIMTRPMVKVLIFTLMEQNMRVNGIRISSREREPRDGLMVQFSLEIIEKERKME
jgi:hypothetical protein